MPQKRIEYFRLLFKHLAWIKHQFLSGIRDSRKAGSLWGMIRGLGGVRKSIHHSLLAKGLGLLCWDFMGVQEEIALEEAGFSCSVCLCIYIYIDIWRGLWCNGYRRRKWTRRHEFKSWTKLIAFHIALIPLGKVWIQLFSLQLWVNSRTD